MMFLAFSGLRINEALPLDREVMDWKDGLIHVTREKRGINPWEAPQNALCFIPEAEKCNRPCFHACEGNHPLLPIHIAGFEIREIGL